jgi:hypothetical protein
VPQVKSRRLPQADLPAYLRRMPRFLRLWPALISLLAWSPLRVAAAAVDPALAASARRTLHEIVDTDPTFMRVHAAEVLIIFGEGPAMRRQFASELPGSEASVIRVGVWRILAETAPTVAERAKWVDKLENLTQVVGDTDQLRSVECLCKLRVVVTGSTLAMMERLARDNPPAESALPRWSLVLAHRPGALEFLAQLLDSPSPEARQLSAYALRWLQIPNRAVNRRLAHAANREPANTVAYPFLVGAAVMLRADPAHMTAWENQLRQLPASATDDARWEAAQALLPYTQAAELPLLERQLHDPNVNTRVCAAWRILAAPAIGRP